MPHEKQLILEGEGLITSSMALGAPFEVPLVADASPFASFSPELFSFASRAVAS